MLRPNMFPHNILKIEPDTGIDPIEKVFMKNIRGEIILHLVDQVFYKLDKNQQKEYLEQIKKDTDIKAVQVYENEEQLVAWQSYIIRNDRKNFPNVMIDHEDVIHKRYNSLFPYNELYGFHDIEFNDYIYTVEIRKDYINVTEGLDYSIELRYFTVLISNEDEEGQNWEPAELNYWMKLFLESKEKFISKFLAKYESEFVKI